LILNDGLLQGEMIA